MPCENVRDPGSPDGGQARPGPSRRSKRASISWRGKPGEAAGIGEVVARREPVIKADLVGQIADPALHLERIAQRIEAGDLGASARSAR